MYHPVEANICDVMPSEYQSEERSHSAAERCQRLISITHHRITIDNNHLMLTFLGKEADNLDGVAVR
jgi:hypothetical protein